jgi:quinol monooxygenase YgiN
MIVVSGTARVRSDGREAAIAAARAMTAASLAEPGCHEYRFAVSLDDPDVVHVFEEWESAEALEAHFATAHMATFMEALGAVLDGSPVIERFEVTGKAPLF